MFDRVTKYINGHGEFVDANKIKVTHRDMNQKETGKLSTETEVVTGEKILIAVGGRPDYPNTDGLRRLAISSDDLFSLKDPPGKTLIIGAGCILWYDLVSKKPVVTGTSLIVHS